MAFFSVPKIKIEGISACLPKQNASNLQASAYISAEDMQKIAKTTGIENRRIATKDVCTSDLCFYAAEKLLEELNWDRNEIGVLVFVSQTPDFILPMTSTILQDRLKISSDCMCFDSTNGCSGYVYGLSIISSLLSTSRSKKALLLVGDTISKLVSKKDRSSFPLFGDAGTATAISIDDKYSDNMFFHLASDGSGYKAIIISDGGQRSNFSSNSLNYQQFEDGKERNKCQLDLNGMDVFTFGINKAPQSVAEVLKFADKTIESVDYFIFHQANKLMNDTIRKKLRLPVEKVPSTLAEYGNTSSATIPLTVVSKLREKVTSEKLDFLFCGFGVGLSWGSVIARLDNIACPPIIEV